MQPIYKQCLEQHQTQRKVLPGLLNNYTMIEKIKQRVQALNRYIISINSLAGKS